MNIRFFLLSSSFFLLLLSSFFFFLFSFFFFLLLSFFFFLSSFFLLLVFSRKQATKLRQDLQRTASELQQKYEKRMDALREELDLRRKTEIHEIEERKNGQIHALMKQHEKAFSDIKNYYNDITLNNLALINSLQEQLQDMKKKEERAEKLMAEIVAENKKLVEPLTQARAELTEARRQLTHHERDRKALTAAKSQVKSQEEALKRANWEYEVSL